MLVALSLVLAASFAGGPSATAATLQTARTTVLPQIVQQGLSPAGAHLARVAGEVKFGPVKKGRPVVIQKRLGAGSWTKVKSGRTNGKGVVTFVGPARKGDRWYSYRGVASAYQGLAKKASAPASAAVWATKFDDQFTAWDATKWADRVSNAPARSCSSVGTAAARSVRDGTLRLSAKLDPAREGETCRVVEDGTTYNLKYYLNGQVSTQHVPHHFRRGVFAARMKFAQRRGQHGSFWLQPTTGFNPEGAEIDVVEFFGKGYYQGGLASFIYDYGSPDGSGGYAKIGGLAPKATQMLSDTDNWWKSYHVFSLEWTPSRYIFRVDGREHFRTSRGVSSVDQYLILSQLTSNWELIQAKKLGIQTGGTTHVDWVRVWQK